MHLLRFLNQKLMTQRKESRAFFPRVASKGSKIQFPRAAQTVVPKGYPVPTPGRHTSCDASIEWHGSCAGFKGAWLLSGVLA